MVVDSVAIRNAMNVHTNVRLTVTQDQIVQKYLVRLRFGYSVNVGLDGYKLFASQLTTDHQLSVIVDVGRSRETKRSLMPLVLCKTSETIKIRLSLSTIQKRPFNLLRRTLLGLKRLSLN